jgi:hypothetical protein
MDPFVDLLCILCLFWAMIIPFRFVTWLAFELWGMPSSSLELELGGQAFTF